MMLRRKYKINKHWITDAEDRTVIVEKDKPTLTTCFPFNYIGAPRSILLLLKKDLSHESSFDHVTPPFYFRNITITFIRYSILTV